ncbi:unnamed protein product [Mytilus edulis]|uniref:CARD domain-containing protein n=1 Tax=Mytilus edulis TaxID=6550 RepID=A0A8S3QVE0_MYTED|nr:unnamed protein product [Mytilus edulis]
MGMTVIIYISLYVTFIRMATCVLCPHVSQWELRARGYCNGSHPWYSCLYDENRMTFKEFCKTSPDFQRPGYKFVIRGDFDGKPCDDEHYQPIKFWTNGSSACIFKKSDCNGEGQTKSYHGNVTSNNYECINRINWDGNFRCPLIDYQSMTSQAITRSTACPLTAGTQGHLQEIKDQTMRVLDDIQNVKGNLQEIKDQTKRVHDDIQNVKESGKVKRCIRDNVKDIVTTIKCEPIVDHLLKNRILTDQDKEQILLCLGPQNKNKKLLEIVWKSGEEACIAFLAELNSNSSYRHLVNKMKNTKGGINDFVEELNIEFDGLSNVKIPKEISGSKNKLHEDNCVFLVGGPGTGKSAIMRHIALYLCNEFGFDVVPVESAQSNITEYYNSSRKQVFVVDDMCGKENINIQFVEIWRIKIKQILKLIEKDIHSIRDSETVRIEKESTKGVANITNVNSSNKRSSFIQLDSRMYSYTQRSTVPIIESIWLRHSEIVRQVIKMNCNVNEIDRFKRSALLVASFLGYIAIVKLLIENGAEMCVCDNQGRTPIFAAYADVNQCDENGKSPLYVSCVKGNLDIVKKLLENKAHIENFDRDGRSPFYIASRGGFVAIMEQLLLRDANPLHCNKWDGSVLNITCREGHVDAVKLLLLYNADVSKADSIGNTPIYIAAEEGYVSIVDILLEKNADINISNKELKTPLHAACTRGQKSVVELLLRKSSKRNSKDTNGNTPYDKAKQGGYSDIVAIFEHMQEGE